MFENVVKEPMNPVPMPVITSEGKMFSRVIYVVSHANKKQPAKLMSNVANGKE